jgi:MFS family permease
VANAKLAPVLALGSAQTLAWGSSYYLPAVLATPIARDLGVAPATVFAAFSAALLVSAALGPHAGRAIDRWGGRFVLAATNLVFAAGLARSRSRRAVGPLSSPGRCSASAWAAASTKPRSPRWSGSTAPARAARSPASR